MIFPLVATLLFARPTTPVAVLTAASPAPTKTFFSNSWTQTSKANRYVTDCTTTAGPPAALSILSPDIQKNFELLQSALSGFSVTEENSYIATEQKAGLVRQQTNGLNDVIAYALKTMTYDEAAQKIRATPSQAAYLTFVKDVISYASDPSAWKSFTDKKTAASIFASVKKSLLTTSFDKASLKFQNWENASTGGTRYAIYKGSYTKTASNTLVTSTLGQNFSGTGDTASVRIFVDEKSKEWRKTEATLTLTLGQITVPVKQTCTAKYGKDAIITPPTKSQPVDANTGLQEFQQLVQSMG